MPLLIPYLLVLAVLMLPTILFDPHLAETATNLGIGMGIAAVVIVPWIAWIAWRDGFWRRR